MPKYGLDAILKVEKEVNPPPKELFIGLGWDEDSTTKRKHYRYYFNDELENNKDYFPVQSPFAKFEIFRGQSRGAETGGLFSFGSKKKDASG